MIRRFSFLSLLLTSLASADSTLRIITTTPELADLTRQVGGSIVTVESLAKGTEDIHAIPQRPSFVPKLNRADAVVLLGFEAEHAFLPALLDVAQNPKLRRGAPGYIDCSRGIRPLDVPANLSRAEGELHPFGNPHYNTDPRNAATMIDTIADALSQIDSSHASTFRQNAVTAKKTIADKIVEWKKQTATLKNVKAISHHADMVYLADFVGLTLIGTVELKPGIAPTPTHLTNLVRTMKTENARLILREIQYSDQTALWLAEQTGAQVASVATMGGAFPDSKTYIGFIDHNVQSIVSATKR